MCLKVMPTPTSTDRAGTGRNMETNQPVLTSSANPRDDSKDPPVNVDDDIEPASEVKVYTNEDEDDEVGLPETENSLSRRDKSIEDVKSGLINESEQCKDARTGDQLAFARSFLQEEATLYQYLLNQQAASCALPDNVLNRGNSPASGSAATHPGLQPSLYHLPPPPPNYHYPMLGPAQLEAWHQYQSGTLHVGSPYSLPINTLGYMSRFSPGGLHGHHPGLAPAGSGPQGDHPRIHHINPTDLNAASDVNHHPNIHGSSHSEQAEKECKSRFSPGGLHGHNPGLSPGAALGLQGGHPHTLPHIKPENLDAVSNVNPQLNHHGSIHSGEKEKAEKECLVKKKDVNHIPKPLNAFMLYMQEMRPVVKAECTLKESAAINQILGRRWKGLTRNEQQKYYEKARSAQELHMEMYPDWQARDNYRKGLKKNKKKRDKSDGIKKCRARYGLDQQEAWCKPCKRKKKCIRVQSYNETNVARVGQPGQPAGPSGNNHGCESMGSSTHDMFNHASKPHLDGEEDHINDFDDNDHSPDSTSLEFSSLGSSASSIASPSTPQTIEVSGDFLRTSNHSPDSSLGSTFEQRLTSPAGFSSLNSLGSSASTASPSTPQTLEALGDFLRTSVTM